MSIAFRLDVAALTAQLQADATAIAESVRPAAQAGAQVLYEEVQRNVGRIKPHTGNLARSVYQVHSDRSGNGVEVYHVSWNAKKAPHGHLVEFGHLQRYEVTHDPKTGRFITHKDRPLASPKQIPARPFIRPAAAKFDKAMEAARARLFAELEHKGVVKA